MSWRFTALLYFLFLGPHLQHMEVPRRGVKSELQLSAYTTAMLDPSHIGKLCHSSWQRWIVIPLSGGQGLNRTCLLMDTSQILNLMSYSGSSQKSYILIPKNQLQKSSTSYEVFSIENKSIQAKMLKREAGFSNIKSLAVQGSFRGNSSSSKNSEFNYTM